MRFYANIKKNLKWDNLMVCFVPTLVFLTDRNGRDVDFSFSIVWLFLDIGIEWTKKMPRKN
jgi:hypothetical protein